jgi:hypothetical protein
MSATNLNNTLQSKFDYAILSLILHEMPELTREEIMQNVMSVAHQILILDYHAPQPLNFLGISIRMIEFLAGREHYKNFNNFLHLGRLSYLLESNKLKIISHKTNRSKTFSILLCK